jgi:DNA-binding transcriptional LysR family regulator
LSQAHIKIRHLEIFRAVMQLGSATSAASLLNISQSAVSQQLSHLETALGLELFHREKGRLTPTDDGVHLFQEVEHAFAGFERILNLANQLRDNSPQIVRFAVPHSLSAAFAPQLIAAYGASRPSVKFQVKVGRYNAVQALVAARQSDIGLVKEPADHPGIQAHLLVETGSVCVLPEGHRLADRASLSAADLAKEPLILLGREAPTRYLLEKQFKSLGSLPNVRVETANVMSCCGFVRAGMGVSIVNELMGMELLPQGLIMRRYEPAIRQKFFLVTPNGKSGASEPSDFMSFTRDWISDNLLKFRETIALPG